MPDHVKISKRSYDASGRREKARVTRGAVITAARELLEANGYAGTTVVEVARRAGVSAESVYKGFGTKAALVKTVFDVAIAGDDDPVPVAERPEAQAVRDEPDVREKLRLYAAAAARRAAQSARVQLALRDGAPSDAAINELWQTLQSERLTGMTMLARHLAGTGQLRDGVDVDHTRDVLWTCIAIEVYDLFVFQRGWSQHQYADWLARTLIASLT